MSKCAACDSTIIMGGHKFGPWVCCDDDCLGKLQVHLTETYINPSDIRMQTNDIYKGNCPRCGGPGPLDVFTAKRVTGMIIAFQLSQNPMICCSKCAKIRKLGSIAHCMAFGWWSPKALVANVFVIPWNLIGALFAKVSSVPSPDFQTLVKRLIATRSLATIVGKIQAEKKDG